jgi:hypothetical protein
MPLITFDHAVARSSHGETCIPGVDVEPGPGVAAVKSLGQVVEEHLCKPEANSCNTVDARCTRPTRGTHASLKKFARDNNIPLRTLRRARRPDSAPSVEMLRKIRAGLTAFGPA